MCGNCFAVSLAVTPSYCLMGSLSCSQSSATAHHVGAPLIMLHHTNDTCLYRKEGRKAIVWCLAPGNPSACLRSSHRSLERAATSSWQHLLAKNQTVKIFWLAPWPNDKIMFILGALSLSNVVPYGVPLSVEIRFSSMSCTPQFLYQSFLPW